MPSPRRDVILLALKLGFIAFGGPAAHISMLRREVVERRRWLDDGRFLDLLGITNLVPGPNSTEMVMHVGQERGGGRGLVGAGLAFILPAASITLAFAWLYDGYGTTAEAEWILGGIKPVVLAVVLQAVWNLGRTAVKDAALAVIGAAVFGLYLLGLNELALLFGGALVAAAVRWLSTRRSRPPAGSAQLGLIGLVLAAPASLAATDPAVAYSGWRLFLTFLKIGGLLYGSGYVLVAFLRNDLVERLGWISEGQLLDAIAVGQFTPGPVFTTATFVGYLAGGFPGALLATAGIFLPAFVFAALAHALLDRLTGIAWVRPLLDGVNVAAIGLMAAVAVVLSRDAIVDVPTAILAVTALVLLVRFSVNSALLILAGAAAGGLFALAG